MPVKNLLKDRSPVRRKHATTHLLITVLCFAFSVTATRIFLNLTGFPQIGGGNLHIAHVLWGGLFLFVASLLPLIWVNPWVLNLSALISGLGVGLFIDEVGKFITSTNNYFFPSAAPIIYAFFLLTVLIFIQVKRKKEVNSRELMYGILEDFAEVLDHDLSKVEYDHLMSELNMVIRDNETTQLVNLARDLQGYLKNRQKSLVEHQPDLLERIANGWQRFSTKWLTRTRFRGFLIVGLLVWAAWAVTSQTVMFLATHNGEKLEQLVQQFMAAELIRNASGMTAFEAQILMEGTMGIITLVAVVLFLLKKDRLATWIGIIDLVITLVVVNLLTFYFDQFSTIAFAAVQFLLLVLLLYYKRKFLDRKARP
jgi:hypothetical protein